MALPAQLHASAALAPYCLKNCDADAPWRIYRKRVWPRPSRREGWCVTRRWALHSVESILNPNECRKLKKFDERHRGEVRD